MKNDSPSELKEQARFVAWCREQGLMVMATAQSTYTDSWNAINKNRAAGVTRGFPDLAVIVPARCRLSGQAKLLMIEMKRQKGGSVSPQQKIWLAALYSCEGVRAAVCKGFEAAKNFTSPFIEKPFRTEEDEQRFLNSLK